MSIDQRGSCICGRLRTQHKIDSLNQTLDLSFYSLLALAQALGDQDLAPMEIACISNGLQSVLGEAVLEPARATLLGPIKVIPKEFPGTLCRSVDLDWNIQDPGRGASDIIAELSLRQRILVSVTAALSVGQRASNLPAFASRIGFSS